MKREKISKLPGKFEEILSEIKSVLVSLFGRILERFPEEKRRPIMFGTAGALLFFLVIIIALSANSGRPERAAAQEMAIGPSIPIEELFLPAEPDFLPQFLLEREPRQFWSLDDIRPFWRNPGSPELWRREIHSQVDRLMEGVP